MKCIVCGNEITENHLSGYIFYAGVIADVSPGYGSCHDMKKIKIGVCDKCLSTAEKNNTIEILEKESAWEKYWNKRFYFKPEMVDGSGRIFLHQKAE